MDRRSFVAALVGAAPALRAAERPPNVVFILADDLGGRDIGCYGNRFFQTPNIGRLSSQGAQLTDA